MAEQALQAPDTAKAWQAPTTAPQRGAASKRLAGAIGNQARLRRLSLAPRPWQAKLEIGAVDDPLEREADVAAEAVLRAPSTDALSEPPPHRRPACEATLRRAPSPSPSSGAAAPAIVHEALGAPGRPLENATRAEMEAGFGADFAAVRIHTDSLAAASAKAVGAHAYTVGADIVFGEGRYQPGSLSGRRLIAHELAHTVQQDLGRPSYGGVVRRTVTTPSNTDAAEVTGHMNAICPGSAAASGANVTAVASACTAKITQGCDCACSAMQDTTRTYKITPLPCNLNMKTETMPGGARQTIPESSVWPSTSGPACDPSVLIKIPKVGSAMEFGAFDSASAAFWYDTWRILAHELCGHGVLCQTYPDPQETGNRPDHDPTIDTENKIAVSPKRGHFTDKPRQGEAFTNKIGDRSKITFKLVDGWHYEAP